jgi:uncharacterized protein
MRAKTSMLWTVAAVAAAVAISISMAQSASAELISGETIAITEWMYSPSSGPYEYVEFTNVGAVPIDMTGWSEDDSTREAGKHPFGSTFGIVQPGESVIVCEGDNTVAAFRTYWNLPATVKVISYGTNDNLGRNDEINLYDAAGGLVDRLTYGDDSSKSGYVPGSVRTQGVGGNIPLAYLWQNDPTHAVLSVVGDAYLSHRDGGSGSGDIGNPGVYTPYVPAPEPSSIVLLAAGFVGLLGYAWRKQR